MRVGEGEGDALLLRIKQGDPAGKKLFLLSSWKCYVSTTSLGHYLAETDIPGFDHILRTPTCYVWHARLFQPLFFERDRCLREGVSMFVRAERFCMAMRSTTRGVIDYCSFLEHAAEYRPQPRIFSWS